jgi:hypothetical protein
MSKPLYIYLVERIDEGWHYDEFESMVVAAHTHKDAHEIKPGDRGWCPQAPNLRPPLKVTRIGTAARGVKRGEVLHTHFHHA